MAEDVVQVPGHTVRLIAAKLEPPRTPTKHVVRDRLHAKLDRGTGRQLTLVIGPAGSGKSALLGSWMNRRSILGAGAWLTLDEFDNDPGRLWAYLVAALRRSPVGEQLSGLRDPSLLARGVDAELITEVAAALGGLPVPLVLVLDNVDRLGEGPAAASIAALLRYSLPMLHLVLSSRSEPPLPLGRLHVAGELARLEAHELAFTAPEAAQLWSLRSTPIREDEARALVAQTEGWAGGLCLRAQGEQPEVFAEFFRCEVMAGLTSETREFLLRSSIAGTLTADLACELTGQRHSASTLEWLARQSLAVRAGRGQPSRFRYRQPFLGFLRDEARLALGDELPRLHLRAARWYAAHDEALRAAEHAIAAGDWRYAAQIIVREAPARFLSADRDALRELAGHLPVADAAQDRHIAAALALAAAERGDAHDAEGFLALARRDGDSAPALPAVLHLTELILARGKEDWPAVHAVAGDLSALLDAAPPGALPASAQLRAIVGENVGRAWFWQADFQRAGPRLNEAVRAAQAQGLDLVEVDALGALALLQASGGHLHEAGRLAGAAVRLLEPAGRLRSKHATLSLLALSLIQWLRGHPLKASQRLAAAQAANSHEPSEAGCAVLTAIRAIVLPSDREAGAACHALAGSKVDSGENALPVLARDWLAVAEAEIQLREGHAAVALNMLSAPPQPAAGPLAARATLLAAQAHLASGAPAHAISLLTKLHGQQAATGRWAQVQAWLVHAVAAESLGHDGAVAIALAEALSAAAAEDLFEPFLSAGTPLAALLHAHSDLLAARGGFGHRLRELLPAPGPVAPQEPHVLEPITEREAVVLRYLPTLLTMTDIARELSVSPNTVKSHLRNLYRKLSVGTRRDAVQHARKLGLLRPDPKADRLR